MEGVFQHGTPGWFIVFKGCQWTTQLNSMNVKTSSQFERLGFRSLHNLSQYGHPASILTSLLKWIWLILVWIQHDGDARWWISEKQHFLILYSIGFYSLSVYIKVIFPINVFSKSWIVFQIHHYSSFYMGKSEL